MSCVSAYDTYVYSNPPNAAQRRGAVRSFYATVARGVAVRDAPVGYRPTLVTALMTAVSSRSWSGLSEMLRWRRLSQKTEPHSRSQMHRRRAPRAASRPCVEWFGSEGCPNVPQVRSSPACRRRWSSSGWGGSRRRGSARARCGTKAAICSSRALVLAVPSKT